MWIKLALDYWLFMQSDDSVFPRVVSLSVFYELCNRNNGISFKLTLTIIKKKKLYFEAHSPWYFTITRSYYTTIKNNYKHSIVIIQPSFKILKFIVSVKGLRMWKPSSFYVFLLGKYRIEFEKTAIRRHLHSLTIIIILFTNLSNYFQFYIQCIPEIRQR